MCRKIDKWQEGVRLYLEREGRKVEWLAMVVGCSYTYLSSCLNERTNASVGLLERLELVMHVPPGSLTKPAHNDGNYTLDEAVFIPEDS